MSSNIYTYRQGCIYSRLGQGEAQNEDPNGKPNQQGQYPSQHISASKVGYFKY